MCVCHARMHACMPACMYLVDPVSERRNAHTYRYLSVVMHVRTSSTQYLSVVRVSSTSSIISTRLPRTCTQARQSPETAGLLALPTLLETRPAARSPRTCTQV